MTQINKIGVIGAGQMGNGIAQVFAQAGHDVVLNDISEDQLDKALDTIGKNLERMVSKEKISAGDSEATQARISRSSAMDDLADCDLVIEAATENVELKKKILSALAAKLQPGAIIATNTSSISITALAASTKGAMSDHASRKASRRWPGNSARLMPEKPSTLRWNRSDTSARLPFRNASAR